MKTHIGSIDVIREREYDGFTLMIVNSGHDYACIAYDYKHGQFSAADYHHSGSWIASGWRESSVSYVADWVSRSTAYRRFKEAVELNDNLRF